MKLKKNLKLIILVLVMFFLFSVNSYAGQTWNSLDYDVTLNRGVAVFKSFCDVLYIEIF